VRRQISIQFPLGGLDRKYAYRNQPPYTTINALNVRPRDVQEGRSRGGSRPGLSKAYAEQLGVSSHQVRMLAPISVVDTTGFQYWDDGFDGTSMGADWAAAWGGTLPSITDESFASVSATGEVRAVRAALDPAIDTSKAYSIELHITPYLGAHQGKYRIYACLNDVTPNATVEGIVCELVVTGAGTTSGTLKVYSGSSLAETYNFTVTSCPAYAAAGVFKLHKLGTTVTVSWCGVTMLTQILTTPLTGTRVGFGMEATVSGGMCLTDSFRCQWYATGTRECRRNMIISSAGGLLYHEDLLGVMKATTSNYSLASDRDLAAHERAQVLYIADRGDVVVKGTDGTIGGGGADELDAPSHSDWSVLGLSIYDHVCVITGHSGSGDGTYSIASIEAGRVHLTPAPTAGTCSYRFERGPKKYTPSTDVLTSLMASSGKGQVPVGCEFVELYRDRLVWACTVDYPHQWWMSRSGDPLDYDYGADEDDGARAMSGAASDAGLIAEPITGVRPLSDDFLAFGCENSLWVMRGDPAYGGQLDAVSRVAGMIKGGCCRGPSGELIFLSRNGLCMYVPGGGVTELSREKLPKELQEVDTNQYKVSMTFDLRGYGVHIFLTGRTSRTRLHWWYDYQSRGFWPESYPANLEPFAAVWYTPVAGVDASVVLGCRDGYLRRFDDGNDTDEGTEISSYVLYGPLLVGGDDYNDGIFSELVAVLAENSGAVTASVYAGKGVEEAYKSTAFKSLDLSGGRNTTKYFRARAAYAYLKLATKSAAKRAWMVENLAAVMIAGGPARVP
jgi:hypothetical protein